MIFRLEKIQLKVLLRTIDLKIENQKILEGVQWHSSLSGLLEQRTNPRDEQNRKKVITARASWISGERQTGLFANSSKSMDSEVKDSSTVMISLNSMELFGL